MRTLIRLSFLVIALYLGTIGAIQVATPSLDPSVKAIPIPIATLEALPLELQHNHLYEVTGQVANSWRVGKVEWVALVANDGSGEIVILGANGASLPPVGQRVRGQVVAPHSHPLERLTGVPFYLQANAHWEVIK